MPDQQFPASHNPNVAYKLSGKTANDLLSSINAQNAGHVFQRGASGVNHFIKADSPAPAFVFGIAKIVGADGTCPEDDTEPSGYGFPCRTLNKYLVEFRVYNYDTGDFEEYGEDWEMDASGYWEALNTQASKSPTSGPGYGPIPTYAVGDVVPAYLDTHRGRIIPVHSPYCDDPSAVFISREQKEVEIVPFVPATAAFYVEMMRPGIDDDFRIVASIYFPLVYPDLDAGTYDSSSVFNTIPCPHGTLFRVRQLRGGDASEGSDLGVTTIWERLRFTGIGRRTGIANAAEESTFDGGSPHTGWEIDASTSHRFKDAPSFNVVAGDSGTFDLIQATFHDPQDEWMVGVELYVQINIVIDEFSSSSSMSSSSSSLSSSSSSPSSSLSSSSESSESSSSMSNTLSTSSSSQSISTSSSSQTISTSSSSSYDCVRFVECVEFDATLCELTVTYGQFCLPRGTGILVEHDVGGPDSC